MPPIDAAFATTGPDWNISLGDATSPSTGDGVAIGGAGSDFGGVLTQQLQNLADLQTDAADASKALATGTATDPAETVMAVERARLSMQLASTLRTKGVDAINEIFRTAV